MNTFHRSRTAVYLACFMMLAGCAGRGGILGVDQCADIPCGAIPEPAGTKVCAWQSAQVQSAIADQTVLYQADFVDRTDQLSPAARQRIGRHATSGLGTQLPWVIEPSGDPDLDASRVAAVNLALSQQNITAVEVQIATPAALGLRGPLAEQVAGRVGSGGGSNRGVGAPITQPSSLGRLGAGSRGF